MITINLTGKCENCPAIDPTIRKLYAGDEVAGIFISCENNTLCEHLERYIAKNLAAEEHQKPERPET